MKNFVQHGKSRYIIVPSGGNAGDPYVHQGFPCVLKNDADSDTKSECEFLPGAIYELSVKGEDDDGNAELTAGTILFFNAGETYLSAKGATGTPWGILRDTTVTSGQTQTRDVVKLPRMTVPGKTGTFAALTEDGGSIGGTNDGDLPELVATGAVQDDDSAASNGVAVNVVPLAGAGPLAFLEATTANNADAEFAVGNGGPVCVINDNDSPGGGQVYFDEDAANDDERFLADLSSVSDGRDVFVPLSDGRCLRIKHDASASSNGVALYFDDDAGNNYERLLFVSPTNADGAFDTDDQVGLVSNTAAVRELADAINDLRTELRTAGVLT